MVLNRTYGWNMDYADIAALAMQINGTQGYLVNSKDELNENYIFMNNTNTTETQLHNFDDMKYLRWVVLETNNSGTTGGTNTGISEPSINSMTALAMNNNHTHNNNKDDELLDIDIPTSFSHNNSHNDNRSTHSTSASVVPRLPPLNNLSMSQNMLLSDSHKRIIIDTQNYPYITADHKYNPQEKLVLIPIKCLRVEQSSSSSSSKTKKKSQLTLS